MGSVQEEGGNQSNYLPISTKFAYTAIISCGTLATWSGRRGQGRSESPVSHLVVSAMHGGQPVARKRYCRRYACTSYVRSTGRRPLFCSQFAKFDLKQRRPDQIKLLEPRGREICKQPTHAHVEGPPLLLRHSLSFAASSTVIIVLQLCFRGGW